MVDTGTLAQLRQQLTQQNNTAMTEGKFGLAARCARALDALQRWEEGRQQGAPPADVAELLNVNWADLQQTDAEPGPARSEPSPAPTAQPIQPPTQPAATAQDASSAPAEPQRGPVSAGATGPSAENRAL